ncbi:MAG TPA: glycosyltransferase family 39 protein [Myxococcaceae bacterium]|nr:glycosyltransferase family 39 protein [Myxococcaceae bacterium]
MNRRREGVAIGVIALATLAFHVATNGQYGFFRDELYFLVCGQRLDWGYVDQPAGIALVARLATILAGTSLVGIRMPAALAAAGLVVLTGAFAVRLGGRVFAAVLACLVVAVAPVLAVWGHLLTMNAFQPLVWTGIAWVALSVVEDDRRSAARWALLGLLVGIGASFKYDVAFWVAGLGVGFVLSRDGRRALRPGRVALACLVACLVVAPNLVWQVRHGLPMLELLRNGQLHKNAPFEPGSFLVQQLLLIGPLAAPVWLLGIVSGITRRDRPTAVLSVAFVATLTLMLLGKAKAYYLAPAYPTVLALGAVEVEARIRSAAARWVAAALVVASGMVLLPLVLPVLPVETLLRYEAALHFQPPRDERHEFNALPQHLADEFGWPGIVDAVAAASARLTPEERRTGAIYTFNYGDAAALEFLGRDRGLPTVVSGHNEYWVWGLRGSTLDPVLVVGGSVKGLSGDYREVTEVGRTPADPHAMPYESNRPIHLCRGRKTDPVATWVDEKHFE